MQRQEHKPGLIRERGDAVIALCSTAFIAVLSFRGALLPAPHKTHWMIPLDFVGLPIWVAGIVNVAFYLSLVWATVAVYHNAPPKERILELGWMGIIFLSPFQGLLSDTGAATIQWIKAAGMAAATIAAVMILWEAPARASVLRPERKRGTIIMLSVILILLLVGAFLYWIV